MVANNIRKTNSVFSRNLRAKGKGIPFPLNNDLDYRVSYKDYSLYRSVFHPYGKMVTTNKQVYVTWTTNDIVRTKYVRSVLKPSETFNVVYEDYEEIKTLLGPKGMSILGKIISLVRDIQSVKIWPLGRIEIHKVKDTELKGWEYALLVLHFKSNFTQANKYLLDFYGQLDELARKLDTEEQEIFTRMIYFDVEPDTISED